MTEDTRQRTRSLERLMGGRPASVVIQLVLLSLLVGFVMSVFGFNAADLVRGAVEMVREAIRDGVACSGNWAPMCWPAQRSWCRSGCCCG